MPHASIIIPVFRAEAYLPRCLDSLLAQTCRDWELILVDDCSPDGSGAICDRYAAADRRILALHQPERRGVSEARNRGLSVARGQAVLFCDGDDAAEPEWLARLLAQLSTPGAGLAVCGYRMLSAGDGRDLGVRRFSPQASDCLRLGRFWELNAKYLFNAVWNKAYLRSVLTEHHITFLPGLSSGEDFLFNLQYIRCCPGAICLDNTPLYRYYRDVAGSLTARYTPALWETRKRFMAELYDTIRLLDAISPEAERDFYTRYVDIIKAALDNLLLPDNPANWRAIRAEAMAILRSPECEKALRKGCLDAYPGWYAALLKRRSFFCLYLVNRAVAWKERRRCRHAAP